MKASGMISAHDLDLLKFTDDADVAVAHINNYVRDSAKQSRTMRGLKILGESRP
jgi:predicted Rossmann-fold nucleotide-binding protein